MARLEGEEGLEEEPRVREAEPGDLEEARLEDDRSVVGIAESVPPEALAVGAEEVHGAGGLELALPTPTYEVSELCSRIGQELPVESFHRILRRAATSIRPVREFGASLISCSDEWLGEYRHAFERGVAASLSGPYASALKSTFSTTNLGSRVESGALGFADEHFTVRTRSGEGRLLHLVLHVSHVGRTRNTRGIRWGEVMRLGRMSPCCAALKETRACEDPAMDPRRHVSEIGGALGARRLAEVRSDRRPEAPVSLAIAHSVLQAERMMTEVLGGGFDFPTHVLLASAVVVQESDRDSVLLTGAHHLLAERGGARVVQGDALRTTPSAHRFREQGGGLRVEVDESHPGSEESNPSPRKPGPGSPGPGSWDSRSEESENPPGPPPIPKEGVVGLREASGRIRSATRDLDDRQRTQLEQRAHSLRRELEAHRGRDVRHRVLARPLLNALGDALTFVAPELGVPLLLLRSGVSVQRAHELHRAFEREPDSAAARLALRDLEDRLQSLPHHEAQELLEHLLADSGPLLSSLRS